MGNIRSHKLWTDEEKEILKENYTIYTNKELIEKFFPDRTIRSVECMASLLNIGHKTNETISRSKAHTEEQKKHPTEIDLDDYTGFDIEIVNTTLDKLKEEAEKIYTNNER